MSFQSASFAALAPLKPELIKLCPTFNVVAVVTSDRRVEGFRFDNSQAFSWELRTSRHDSGHRIVSIAWQPNGVFLWIVWTDGQAHHVDTRTGKPSSLVSCRLPNSTSTQVVAQKSRTSVVHEERMHGNPWLQRSRSLREPPQPQDFQGRYTSLPAKDESLPPGESLHSLPRLIALLDLQDELPTLSPLPHVDDRIAFGSYPPNRFVTQAEIDHVMPRPNPQLSDHEAEISEISWDDGTTTFLASNITGSKLLSGAAAATHVLSSSHTFSSCYALLLQNDQEPPALKFISLDAVQKSEPYFHFIPRYMATLNGLAQYVLHCIAAIRQAFKASQDLPSRFLSIVSEDLAASSRPWHLDAALYHQAVTGSCHPTIKEWLVDSLQERGLKRWDAAVSQGYADMVKLLHTYLLPALERASVVASKLRGLTHMQPQHVLLAVPTRNMTRVMDNLDMLRLLATQVLQHAADELKMFAVFSEWLGEQLTLHKAEPDSATAKETLERVAGINYPMLLNYIEGPLLRSHLHYFLGRDSLEVSEARRRPADQLPPRVMTMILDKHNRESTQPKPKTEGGTMEAANLLWQGLVLQDSVRDVREAPNSGFEREMNVVDGPPLASDAALTGEQRAAADLRMVVEASLFDPTSLFYSHLQLTPRQDPAQNLLCTYVAVPLPSAFQPTTTHAHFHLHRTAHTRHLDPLSSTDARKIAPLPTLRASPPPQTDSAPRTLLALRLVSDDILLALFAAGPNMQLWTCPYGRDADFNVSLSLTEHASADMQDWTPDWALAKEWRVDAERAFEAAVGRVEVRLVLPEREEGGASASVVLAVLGREEGRFALAVVPIGAEGEGDT